MISASTTVARSSTSQVIDAPGSVRPNSTSVYTVEFATQVGSKGSAPSVSTRNRKRMSQMSAPHGWKSKRASSFMMMRTAPLPVSNTSALSPTPSPSESTHSVGSVGNASPWLPPGLSPQPSPSVSFDWSGFGGKASFASRTPSPSASFGRERTYHADRITTAVTTTAPTAASSLLRMAGREPISTTSRFRATHSGAWESPSEVYFQATERNGNV